MVLKRFFGRSASPTMVEHSIPAGQRVYAIGDIHGRMDLLEDLLGLIDKDDNARGASDTQLIFLGDLIDRGPQSRRVVDRVMSLVAGSNKVHCLGGNHEDLLLRTIKGDAQSAGIFHRAGGRETLISYGVDEVAYDDADLAGACELAAAHVPASHVKFLSGLRDWVRVGDYAFVHAGMKPGKPLSEQRRSDMRWIRHEFTRSEEDFGAMIIHGHTITEEVDEQSNRIGIDTGAYATGRLTAIGLQGTERWFLQTSGAPG